MKRTICLSTCLLLWIAVAAQTQEGVSYQYNGKKPRTPLGNVTISYDNNKRTVLSDAKSGKFSLTLEGRKMGDRIGLVTVKKREMMVFNQHAVDEWSLRKEPLCLILCNADEFERQKANLIEIGKREAKKKYDQQKAELEAKLNASQMKQQEYEDALDKAYDELNRFQKNVGEYADLFARIDESEVDTLAQRALDLFNQGHVDEAIRLFEQGHYMEKLDKALKNSQQADQLKTVAEKAKELATQDSLKALQSLKAQIEAYKMNNEWNKAGELLKGLADRLNTVDDCWAYAYFCSNQNNFKDTEVYYKRAISLLDEHEDKGTLVYLYRKSCLLNNLAFLYSNTQRFTESEEMYKEALEIYRRLALSNPQAYEPDVAGTLNNLAGLYCKTQRFTESEAMYKEVLEIRHRHAKADPQAYEYDVATTLNDLASLYYKVQRFTESEALYKEALEKRRRLAKTDPQAHEPNLAATLNNLAGLYYEIKRFAESEAMFKEVLEIYRRLAKANQQAYEPYVAQTQYNIGLLKINIEQYEDAIPPLEEALNICRRISQTNPAQKPYYESSLYLLAKLYSINKDYLVAYRLYQEWLPIMKQRYEADPASQQSDYADQLGSQSFCCIFAKQFAEAEQYAREGLAIEPTKHFICGNLAAALLFQGKYQEAEQIYRQYKDELKDDFLDDFKEFAETGVIPQEREADVERIKRLIEE